MTATHFNVLAQRAPRQQRRAPADDGVASAVHRCGRDVWRWLAPTDQGTSERDDRAHRVGSTSRQVDGVDAAEAPSDQAHRAVLVRCCEKLIETVADVATEAAVDAETPSVAAVTKAINEPAKWCSGSIVAAQSGQHKHGVAVATARHRQQRTYSHRKRGELGSRSNFPSHHCLPPRTLRHASLFPASSSTNTSPAQPATQPREDPALARASARDRPVRKLRCMRMQPGTFQTARKVPRSGAPITCTRRSTRMSPGAIRPERILGGCARADVQGRSSDGAGSVISRLGSDYLPRSVQKRPPSTMNCWAVQPPLSSAARKRIICANSSGRIRFLSA
jgi:hypothetical protein